MTTGPLLRARNTDVSSRIPRHCITIAILVSLGRWEELEIHVRAALEEDLSQDQIAEVLLPTAIYGGVPAANAAFDYADRVLRPKDTRA
jgi:alkylhydroperoxidase/carboxymuconolactone decarboxylase family protein YurZ